MVAKKRERASRQDRGYDAKWYRLQKSHLKKNPICACPHDNPDCQVEATQADHIRPFSGKDDPLRLDPENLQSLCISCHAVKTAMDQKAKPKLKPGPKPVFNDEERADRNRERNRVARQRQSRTGQDIGEIPPVKDWNRRLACRNDLAAFCKTYLGRQFYLPYSSDHLKHLRKAQQAVLHGGLFAQAAPRGDGKSERTKATSLWAILYGHRRFILMVGASAGHASELLDGVRFYMESFDNFPFLLEDFPEALFPIRALDGEARRQGGQRCGDVKTDIHWGGDYITMPTVPEGNWIDGKTIGPSPSAGATIRITGITGRLRGFNVNGTRPDLVLPDDPQTDESALSPTGNEKIERILSRAVIGLAGPDKKIAGIMPCTVIQPGDAMDKILNHELHPEWDSERTKMLYAFPSKIVEENGRRIDVAKEMWEKYKEIRYNYNPNLGEGEKKAAEEKATEFYYDNHETMSHGAIVAWPERYNPDELDGLQRAMNMFLQDKRAFFAEGQNDPMPIELGDMVELTPLQIAAKVNSKPRLQVPLGASKLTAFIDVQQQILFYVVCAWADDFTGWIIDYGTYPDQRRQYFSKADITHTFDRLDGLQNAGIEAQVFGGLERLTSVILGMTWVGETNAAFKIDQCFIDSGFQTQTIYSFCRSSPFAAIITPSKGSGIGPANRSITDHTQAPGEKIGLEWYALRSKDSRGLRLVHYDTNFWKTFVKARLAVPTAGHGALSLFGDDPHYHRMFSEHLCSEFRVRTTSIDKKRSGRIVDVWDGKPGRPDNDFWDALVGDRKSVV